MDIVYTRHARLRMDRRAITEQEIEYTLGHAHTRFTDPDGNPVFIASIGERRLKVVTARGATPTRVITVIWLD